MLRRFSGNLEKSSFCKADVWAVGALAYRLLTGARLSESFDVTALCCASLWDADAHQVAPFLPNLSTKRRDKKEELHRRGFCRIFGIPFEVLALFTSQLSGPPQLYAGGAGEVSQIGLGPSSGLPLSVSTLST